MFNFQNSLLFQSGLCTMSELDGPRGSIRIQHRNAHIGLGLQPQSSIIGDSLGPAPSLHVGVARKVK